MSLEPRLPEPSENGTHRSTLLKLLAGAAALTLAATMAFVVVASATSGPSSKSVRMASASGSAALTPTEIGVHGELNSGSASASASAPTGIIATATNGLKGLAAAAHPKSDPETTTTTLTGSTTSTTADDSDNDETEPGVVTGTVASISGTGFTVSVAGSTTPKTVTTSSSTMFIETVAGTVADAKPGTEVLAIGTRDAAGALVATKLAVLPASGTGADPESDHGGGAAKPTGSGSGSGSGSKEGSEHSGFVVGQVTANTGGTLTVTTHDGPQTVITTAATTVTVTTQAALSAVTPGATVQVKGTTAADGSLAARLVHIGTVPMGTGGDDHEGLAAGLDREVGAHD